MPLDTYYHLKAADFVLVFPAGLDPAPILLDKRTYFDDWIMNRMFIMMQNVQQFLIDNKAQIEV